MIDIDLPRGQPKIQRITADWTQVIASEYGLKSKARLKQLGIVNFDTQIHPGYEQRQKEESFCTGSKYEGSVNILGFSGTGKYTFPHGVTYEGEFMDGMFHGKGTLTYPNGQQVVATWSRGKFLSNIFKYPDGLPYKEPWNYCKMPNRRFRTEYEKGLQPARNEFLTNLQPTRKIPEKCYDTGYGFYNPLTKSILLTEKDTDESVSHSATVEIPSPEFEAHIIRYYRKAWDEAIGYNPEFYEFWTMGKKEDRLQIEKTYDYIDESTADLSTSAPTVPDESIVEFDEFTKDSE